jgi:Ca2+-binding RTX toxin-like protein
MTINLSDTLVGAAPSGDVVSFSPPDTTITGPILDVAATTNYTGDTIDDVSAITFDATAAATAIFSAAQFGGGAIASNATITGNAHTDSVDVHVGSGKTFDGTQLQFAGWSASDKFEITATGDHATITGTSANDIIDMGASYDTTDAVNGGGGSNTLELNGNYSSYVDISAGMFQNISTVELVGGNNYSLDMVNGAVQANETITFDASRTLAGDQLTLDTNNDSSGSYVFDLGAGDNDVYFNGDHIDTVHCTGGANDISIYGVMPTGDRIDGAGTTNVSLFGDYSAGYSFGAKQLVDVGAIYLQSGFSYNLTLNNAQVPVGGDLVVNGEDIDTAHSLILNGSHVTNGVLNIFAGGGLDDLTGGTGSDSFLFYNGDQLTAADHINGGGGSDNTLTLAGDYSAGVKFGNDTIHNIQYFDVDAGDSYNFTLAAGNVAAGQTLSVEGKSLGASNSLDLNGSKVAGNLFVTGGAGNDAFVGGSGTNTFDGGAGADVMTAGSGPNSFVYGAATDSTRTTHDTIVDFNALNDTIELTNTLTLPGAINPSVTSGTLATAHFDADLAAAVGGSQLLAHDAVLFTPSAGNLAGHTFLIIDENGTAGYQAGADLVVELTNAINLSHFSTSDFT